MNVCILDRCKYVCMDMVSFNSGTNSTTIRYGIHSKMIKTDLNCKQETDMKIENIFQYQI